MTMDLTLSTKISGQRFFMNEESPQDIGDIVDGEIITDNPTLYSEGETEKDAKAGKSRQKVCIHIQLYLKQ